MKLTKKTLVLLGGACLLATPQLAFAQDEGSEEEKDTASSGTFSMNTGVSYSNGNYGELEKTEVIAVPFSLSYKKDGFKVRVSVPWVMIDGPGSLLSTPEGRDAFFGDDSGGGQGRGRGRGRGGDGDNSGSGSSNSGSGSSGSGSGGSEVEVEDELDGDIIDDDDITDEDGFAALDNKRSGFGDVNISALYSFQLGSGTYFEPQVKFKLPTASRSKRLGTGEIDVTVSADLVQEVGPMAFYVHGRRKFADKPEGSAIQSTWGAGAGASIKAGDGVNLGADYFWQESAFDGRQASSEVSAWANFHVGVGFSLTAYGGIGLNDASAGVFAGIGIGKRF